MIGDELTRLAGLLSGSPIGPDSYKLDELLAGLDTERSRLGRRRFAVVLYRQVFDLDGLTDYVFLLDSFDTQSEAIACVESSARDLLSTQTVQANSWGQRWALESEGDVRSLPNARAGLWALESEEDMGSVPNSTGKRLLRTLHDRTYKLRASGFDMQYNCFRAIGPFADFVVGDQLFEFLNSPFLNSRHELWSYFVKVGEAVRAGKPSAVPI